jgi:hypothetical protein
MLLLGTNILIDVLRGEAVALAWLERQMSLGGIVHPYTI